YEFTAYVKNINENHSEGLQKKCNALYDYSRFVGKVRRNKDSGIRLRENREEFLRFFACKK
ncbi:MAG: hypothetical protein J5857_11475, partial [Treponema sp.]|nr:hypothetical protein [Treponema sp.]